MPLVTCLVRRRALLGLLLILASFSAARAAETGHIDQLRSRALALVNQDRTERGLNRLQLADNLNEVAQAHGHDMLRRSYFAHASPEGDTARRALPSRASPPSLAPSARWSGAGFAPVVPRSGANRRG